jgi:hypothetical protein
VERGTFRDYHAWIVTEAAEAINAAPRTPPL